MMAFDGEAFGKEIVGAVRAHVDRSLAPILDRLEALEARQLERGVAGAVIDRDGNLVITTTDGIPHNLGRVVGRDGTDGAKGDPGKDGADALGFDDMDATYDGGRTITLRFARGDRVKEFAF